MSNTPITNWSGAYQTTTQGSNGLFSPLIVNDDGSIDINGTLITPNYDPDTATLSFDWTAIGSSTVKAQFTFSNQNGTIGFSGTIYPNQQSNGLSFSGTEITPLPVPSLANLVPAGGLFDTGDQTFIGASNGMNLSNLPYTNGRVQVVAEGTTENSLNLNILKNADDQSIYIQSANNIQVGDKIFQPFFTIGEDNLLYVDASSTAEATRFQVSLALNGQAVIATADGRYLMLNGDNTIGLLPESSLGIAMEFSFNMYQVPVEQLLAREGLALPDEITDCETAWAGLIWQLTGGLFLSLGLGPFIATGRTQLGVLGLLRANATVWTAIQNASRTILQNTNPGAVATVATGLLTLIYQQGLLWKLVKFVLTSAGWWIVFRILAKILEVILLPEVEAAELVASFAIWAVQTVNAARNVASSCSGDIAPFPKLADSKLKY